MLLRNALQDPKEWIPSLWAIWYSCELLPKHDSELREALSELVALSRSYDAWVDSDEPICSMCRFEGDTLKQVRQLWKMWLEGSFGTPISWVNKFQSAQRRSGYKPVKVSGTVSVMMGTGKDAYPPGAAEAMEMEYTEYTMNGVALAESVCDLPLPAGASTLVNPTFFETTDAYTLYGLVPYKCFYHSVQFSAGALLQGGVTKQILKSLPMIVSEEKFTTRPFLANSVQQFALWMNGAAKVMQARKYAVKFTFHCSDAVEYCQELSQTSCPTFDVIYTSNVIDYLGPLILVLSAVPLLSENGVLVSTSLHYLNLASDTDEYLSRMLGFEVELFPVLFDIQCLGHEGRYNNNISIHSTPFQTSYCGMSMGFTDRFPNVMIWERCRSTPLKMETLLESPSILNALHSIAQVAITSLLLKEIRSYSVISMSTETAVRALQFFMSNLHPDAPSTTYQYWDGLSQLLKADDTFKLHMSHFQTLALLHGLHLHLVYTASDCPLCNQEAVTEAVKQINIEFAIPPPHDALASPIYIALIHKGCINDLPMNAIMAKCISVVDTLACFKENSTTMKVSLFLPTSLCTSRNNISVVAYEAKVLQPVLHTGVYVCNTVPLCDIAPLPDYTLTFSQPKKQDSHSSSFGIICKHIGDSDKMFTDIALDKATALSLESNKLSLENPSKSTIELVVSDKHFTLLYLFAINYPKSKIRLSRKDAMISVSVQRNLNLSDRPLFYVSRSNLICLRKLSLSNKILADCGNAQLTQEDLPYSKTYNQIMYDVNLPVLGAKSLLSSLLQKDKLYYSLYSRKNNMVYGLIAINEKLYDIEKQSPALDMHYYISTQGILSDLSHPVYNGWCVIQDKYPTTVAYLRTTEGEIEVLEATFKYFSARTVKRTNHKQLSHLKIEHLFGHAVVYPLYADKDKCALYFTTETLSKPSNPPARPPPSATEQSTFSPKAIQDEERCSFCSTTNTKLLKCSRCAKVQYCNKKCQVNHWAIHKATCTSTTNCATKLPAALPQPSKQTCSTCGKENFKLRQCPCHSVAYCDGTCQKMDWPKHRAVCSATLDHTEQP